MKKRIYFALLLMGFTSLVVQTLLIREFLISFYGNELTIGIILANWIILEAMGSLFTSRLSQKAKRPFLSYALLQTGICVYLPFGIFFIRTIKNILGLTLGEAVGILPVFFSSFFILGPLSIFDGSQFPFGCRILGDFSKKHLESAGRVYILEAIGFILAGPLFTYLLITKLNSFQIAFFIGMLNLSSGLLLLKDKSKNMFLTILFLTIIFLLVLCTFMFFVGASGLQRFSVNQQYKGQKVLDYRNSIYGNLVATSQEDQYTFYSDGIPIITTPTPDIVQIEELVHFAMLTCENPRSILLLSGGTGGLIGEIIKYPIQRIDYAELDPALIRLIKNFPTDLTQKEFGDRRLSIKYIDGRRYVRLTDSKYDLILLNLPPPTTLQLNRFYTKEFYKNIKSILKEAGVFAFSLPGSLSYISNELKNLNGCIINTLKSQFPHVYVIPGDFNIYLASSSKLNISPEIFLGHLKENNVTTRLITQKHLEYRLSPYWKEWFWDSLGDISKIRKNSDLLSSGVFYGLAYWNSLFSPRLNLIFRLLDKLDFNKLVIVLFILGTCIILCLKILPLLKKAPVGFAIGTTGFVGMTFDLIFIFTYQSFYGFVFHHLALLVTAFMAGLTLGGWLMTRRLFRIKRQLSCFSKIELSLILFCLIVSPLLIYLDKFPRWNLAFVFFFLSGISGFLVGSEFPLANKIYFQSKEGYTPTAGILYGLDLVGAWAAAIVVSVALVPIMGILKTCILLAILKIVSLISVSWGKF